MEIQIFPCENATAKIQRAIDEVSAHGGGRVVIEDGEYLIKSILLRSGVCLYLKSGATVKGSRNPDDYDLSSILSCPKGLEYGDKDNPPIAYLGRGYNKTTKNSVSPFTRWSRAMIKAYRASDISVIGENGATFDGQNTYDALGEEGYRGPHFINFHECENVTLKGYTIKNSGNWGNAIFTSHNILVENITVLAGHDGLDLMSCDDVTVRNCDFKTGDDCIAGFDCEVVLVENCKLNSSCNALRIGGNNFIVRGCAISAPGVYGHRYGMSLEEKMRGDTAYQGKARSNMEAVVNYYCDDRFIVRKPVYISVEDCEISGADKLLDYGFTDPNKRWIKNKPMEHIRFVNINAKGLKYPSELYAPDFLPLTMEIKNSRIDIEGDIFAVFENTNFAFENVDFGGKKTFNKGFDGKLYEIETQNQQT